MKNGHIQWEMYVNIPYHGNPQPSFLGVISPIFWWLKTFMAFTVLGSKGTWILWGSITHFKLRFFFAQTSAVSSGHLLAKFHPNNLLAKFHPNNLLAKFHPNNLRADQPAHSQNRALGFFGFSSIIPKIFDPMDPLTSHVRRWCSNRGVQSPPQLP